MDNKQKKKINKSIGCAFNITLDFVFTTVKLLFLVILIIGAFSAFLLYTSMFPEKALELREASKPVLILLINILQAIVGLSIGILIGWLSFNILEPIMSKSKKRREKRREDFLDDLSEKLKKKLKKK